MSHAEIANVGGQKWQDLKVRKPTIAWEAFPRKGDFPESMLERVSDVRYEFRMTRARKRNPVGFTSVNDKPDNNHWLIEPKFTVEKPLNYCDLFLWTVRAHFKLNNEPRVTEWAGVYHIIEDYVKRPWKSRMNIDESFFTSHPQSSYFYTVKSPQNPFAGECVYD